MVNDTLSAWQVEMLEFLPVGQVPNLKSRIFRAQCKEFSVWREGGRLVCVLPTTKHLPGFQVPHATLATIGRIQDGAVRNEFLAVRRVLKGFQFAISELARM